MRPVVEKMRPPVRAFKANLAAGQPLCAVRTLAGPRPRVLGVQPSGPCICDTCGTSPGSNIRRRKAKYFFQKIAGRKSRFFGFSLLSKTTLNSAPHVTHTLCLAKSRRKRCLAKSALNAYLPVPRVPWHNSADFPLPPKSVINRLN